ncbi:hypothetical protein CASFOL_038942 [Castilleja foliolosa]|uniref:Desiccation-related protein PCC13-62 n=1 Tax=Castilleja foliolosa TaxID=1961234 RepID=A0ABD3BIE9_9LAMI
MAFFTSATFFLILLHLRGGNSQGDQNFTDSDYVELFLNVEYLETEFFLNGALGYGLDQVAPELSMGGPPPIGATRANLSLFVRNIMEEFGYQEVGHLRAIKSNVRGFARPQVDISPRIFADFMNKAFGQTLDPLFDPFANDINFLIASYAIPYVALTAYVGTIPILQDPTIRELVAGLLGVESGQDAVIRTLLSQSAYSKVKPYEFTVEEFTTKISGHRDSLGNEGVKDEAIIVDPQFGAEERISGNVLSANNDSLSYSRTAVEIIRILYGGLESKVGGFFPNGAEGKIAKSYL